MSQALLGVPLQGCARATREWLEAAVKAKAPGTVFCADTNLLFEPCLQLDPLALFQQIRRVTPVVVFWAGKYEDGALTYAVPEHGHYRACRTPEVEIKGVADVLS